MNTISSDFSMASRAGELNFDDPEYTEAWLRCFAASARSKKLKDEEGSYAISDLFLAKAGVDAIRRVSVMAHPKNLENMKFEDIRIVIMAAIRPQKKLVIAERVKFLSLHQGATEGVQRFVERLRQAAKFCEFDKLGSDGQSIEDDLIQMTLIDGLCHTDQRIKTLEFLQSGSPKLAPSVDFVRQLEMIEGFSKLTPNTSEAPSLNVAHVDKNKVSKVNCKFCGYQHPVGKCPAYGKTCSKCGKHNHFQKVCKSSSKRVQEVETEETASVFAVESGTSSSVVPIKILNLSVNMQIDTGSEVTIIPRNFWEEMGKPKLRKSLVKLKQFDGSTIKLLGKFEALLESENKVDIAEVIVADCIKGHGLIGMDVLKADATVMMNHVRKDEVGRLKDFKADIILKSDAKPFYSSSRPIPIHLKPLVIKKLNQLIDQGLLERVPPGGSEWASPLVVVRKADGDLRLCGDYKLGVNPRICCDSYPTPSVEVALNKLAGSKSFAKIDLKGAYHQIEMSDNARSITTINTPIGLLRWTCLPYGIKTASAIFQRAIEYTLGIDCPRTVIYQDDICIGADNPEKLRMKVDEVLNTLFEAGLQINKDKCIMEASELSFLGYKISSSGVKPDNRLVQKVLDVKTPVNKKELSSFIGLVNFYGRFISGFSDKIHPLLQLRKDKEEFNWTATHQKAFEGLKRDLSSEPVIQIYNPNKELTLETDASEQAISGVLTQDGHPVLYLSRTLSPAESHYSNIEREALAIVWATHRARHFLLGRNFKIISDHRPLEFLFSCEKGLPKVTSARLLRWALHMSAFSYQINYAKGETIPHVDALSRLKFSSSDEFNPEKDQFIHFTETDVLNMNEIQQETMKDDVIVKIMERIRRNNWSNCSVTERPFKSNRQKLSVESGVLCASDLIVPPLSLRNKFISAVHDDIHPGVIATRNRLRLEAWWPGYCADVEQFVARCPKCAEIKPPKEKFCHTWPEEKEAWTRVHMDHAYVPGIGLLLILVDAFSGWPEVVRVANRSASTVKHVLRVIFSRNGVPKCLVSDNAREFHDELLCSWLLQIGCKPMKTPPYHPQSNGIAERMVHTVKQGLKAFCPSFGNVDSYLCRMLLSYRSIPHGERRHSPSALMGRQIRSPMTFSFETGDNIWYRKKTTSSPESAVFISQAGSNTAVILKEGQGTLAHKDQINKKPDESLSAQEPQAKPTRNIWTDFLHNHEETGLNEAIIIDDDDDVEDARISEQHPPVRRSDRSNFGLRPDRYVSKISV